MMHVNTYSSFLIAATVVAVIGACFDALYRIIPNYLTLPTIVIALVLHAVSSGIHGFAGSLLATVVAGAIFSIFFAAGGMGGGDVKLIVATSALAGFPDFMMLLQLITLCGGVMALWMAFRKQMLGALFSNMLVLARHHRENGIVPHNELNTNNKNLVTKLPYGVAIGIGTALTLYLRTAHG